MAAMKGPVRTSLGEGQRNVNNLQKHRENILMGDSWNNMIEWS